jgi:hypothetical protein
LAFGDTDFEVRLETLFAAMLAQEGVRLPGDRRLVKRLEARSAWVSIRDKLYQRLLDYGSRSG